MNYDPELPAGFQDADIEMRDLERAARRSAQFRKQGICDHGWVQCPPGPPNKPTTVCTCHDCGRVFPTEAALDADRELAREAML